jgi:hypothetical protein
MTAPAGPAEPLPPHDAVPLKPRPTTRGRRMATRDVPGKSRPGSRRTLVVTLPFHQRVDLVEPDEVESCRYPKVEPGALNAQPVTTSC